MIKEVKIIKQEGIKICAAHILIEESRGLIDWCVWEVFPHQLLQEATSGV